MLTQVAGVWWAPRRGYCALPEQVSLVVEEPPSSNGRGIRVQISFRAEEPDGRGIVSVTGEEKSVRTIDQGNGASGCDLGCDHSIVRPPRSKRPQRRIQR